MASLAIDRMDEHQLWNRLLAVVHSLVDDAAQGRLSRTLAESYRDQHEAIVRELRMRGHIEPLFDYGKLSR